MVVTRNHPLNISGSHMSEAILFGKRESSSLEEEFFGTEILVFQILTVSGWSSLEDA